MATGRHTHNTDKYSAFTIYKKVQFRLDASNGSEPRPGWARTHPFFKSLGSKFWKGPRLELGSDSTCWKGPWKLEFLWSKIRGRSRLRLELFRRAWAGVWLEFHFQGLGLAWAQSFRAQPIPTMQSDLINTNI